MKKTRIWQILGLFVVILALSACGGNGEVDTSTPPELPEDAESLVMLAKFDLTLKTGIAIEDITTKSITENNFDDASLGIPDPGVTYEAVVTPGIHHYPRSRWRDLPISRVWREGSAETITDRIRSNGAIWIK